MLKNGQRYFKNLTVWTPQNFKGMFGRFSTLWMKGLNENLALEYSKNYRRYIYEDHVTLKQKLYSKYITSTTMCVTH